METTVQSEGSIVAWCRRKYRTSTLSSCCLIKSPWYFPVVANARFHFASLAPPLLLHLWQPAIYPTNDIVEEAGRPRLNDTVEKRSDWQVSSLSCLPASFNYCNALSPISHTFLALTLPAAVICTNKTNYSVHPPLTCSCDHKPFFGTQSKI